MTVGIAQRICVVHDGLEASWESLDAVNTCWGLALPARPIPKSAGFALKLFWPEFQNLFNHRFLVAVHASMRKLTGNCRGQCKARAARDVGLEGLPCFNM